MPALDKPGTPEKLNNPEKRAQYLLDVYLRTMRDGVAKDVVADHGTSVQVLKYLIQNGVLPGQSGDSEYHQAGDLFVKLRPEAIPNRKSPSALLSDMFPPEMLAEVSVPSYAAINAEKDYIMERLGIPLSDQKMTSAVQHFGLGDSPSGVGDLEVREAMIELLNRPAIPERGIPAGVEVYSLVGESKKRQGVTIGIRRAAITKNSELVALARGDTNEGDAKMVLGKNGLNIRYVGSLEFGTLRDAEDFAEFIKQFNLA